MSSSIQSSKILNSGLTALENIGRTVPSPFAAGVLTGAKSVIETLLTSKDNDPASQSLGVRVLEISSSCMDALPKEGIPRDFQATYYIGQLLHVLNRIAKRLRSQSQRGRLAKLVLQSRENTSLKELGEQLEQCAAMLMLHLQMDTLRLSNKMAASAGMKDSEVELTLARAQKEELDLIKSHFTIRSSENISRNHLPPPPHIFHGRTEETERILHVLLSNEASYVCILGTGGVGKTSFGLSTTHHPDIVKHYQSYRYFIPCDSLTDAAALLTTLANLFRVIEKGFWTKFAELCRSLNSKILLMLDNFETPWESAASRKEVETFLSKLADIPNLSIVLTLRGSERPYGVSWTRPFLNPLTTLDLLSARKIFTDISDISESSPGLDELLQAVDMLPLAVTLLANQAQFTSCSDLLELWHTRKTSMVTRGIQDRISNLDVSIQISLASPRLVQCEGALNLLQILSVLPDGADDTGVKGMAPANFDLSAATTAVLRVGLAYRNEAGRLRSLAPVREHLQTFQPMTDDLFRGIAVLHNGLARDAEHAYVWEDDRSHVVKTLTPQLGNFHSVLALSLEKAAFKRDAVAGIASIHYLHRIISFGPNRRLLDAALATAISLGDSMLEADCLLAAHFFEPKDRIRITLNRVLEVYRASEDPVRLSRCLLAISHQYLNFGSDARGIAAALEIIDTLQAVTPVASVASAYDNLIRQYCAEGNMPLARSFARRAMQTPNLSGSAKGYLLQTIAHLHGASGRLSAALQCFTQSAEVMETLGDYRSGIPQESIAQVYFMQSRLTLCLASCTRAASIMESTSFGYRTTHEPYYSARLAVLMDNIPLALSKCQILHSTCLKEESSNVYSQMAIKQRFLSCALAEVEMHEKNWSAAAVHLKSTQDWEAKLGWVSHYGGVESMFCQGDLWSATGQASRTLGLAVVCAICCCRQADAFGLSMALQRIGDYFFYNSNSGEEAGVIDDARTCYEAALDIIQDPRLDMGANRHLGDSLLRLGMVALRSGTGSSEAGEMFGKARESYFVAEDKDGVRFCDERLVELSNGEEQDYDSVSLPLGNRLFFSV